MAKIDENYLAVMQMDSIDLLARKDELTPMGAKIRKELQRRKCTNYWSGPFPIHKGGPDGTLQTPSVVGTVRTYVKGSK